jgi:hypothetical protein
MTRLRFIKPWSTYRPGDTMDTESQFTVERMVRTHGVCVVDRSVTLDSPIADEPVVAESQIRAIEAAPRDKMVRAAGKMKKQKSL